MSSVDWQSILNTLLVILGGVLVSMIKIYVPRVIDIVEQWVKIKLTDQERAAIVGAAVTGAGILQTKIDQGILKVKDIQPDNKVVQEVAKATLSRVADSAESQGTGVEAMAAILVGKVDTSPKVVPVVAAIPPVAPEVSEVQPKPKMAAELVTATGSIFPHFDVDVPMPVGTAIPPSPIVNPTDRLSQTGATKPPFQNPQGVS